MDTCLDSFDPVKELGTFSNIFPSIELFDSMLVLYPSPSACYLDEIPVNTYNSLLVLEGTWQQSVTMMNSLENYYLSLQDPAL
jgi:hypothetical protein